MKNQEIHFDTLRQSSIGTIDFISPNEFKVVLENNAPQNIAFNNKTPVAFPKINNFVIIPNEVGAVVGVIAWIGIEHSPYQSQTSRRDLDLIDLPFPLRRMSIQPLGTLRIKIRDGEKHFEIERGVYSFPSVGDLVYLPNQVQVANIVENRSDRSIQVGVSNGSEVYLDIDKIFGRHVAVLGNTGSGKSCTVAGLLRWSIELALAKTENAAPNVIIIDPNGEYSTAFNDLGAKVFKVFPDPKKGEYQLTIPSSFWNKEEWISFAEASERAQTPILLKAISYLKTTYKNANYDIQKSDLWFQLKMFQNKIHELSYNLSVDGAQLINTGSTIDGLIDLLKNELFNGLDVEPIRRIIKRARPGGVYVNTIYPADFNTILLCIEGALETLGFNDMTLIEADVPVSFDSSQIPKAIKRVATTEGTSAIEYIRFLEIRMEAMLQDKILKNTAFVNKDITLEDFFDQFSSKINIIDVSLLPSSASHIMVGCLTRLLFEYQQRRKFSNLPLKPLTLVLEEAHNFISRDKINGTSAQAHCSKVFEKVAKEGRKFGLGLVISSQRPSELSQTVVSQCNTFILHRIVNDQDQDLVKKFIPDNLGSLLRELPSLPSQKAIILGWASIIPTLTEIRSLRKEHRPDSEDPMFFQSWTTEHSESTDDLFKDWTKTSPIEYHSVLKDMKLPDPNPNQASGSTQSDHIKGADDEDLPF